MIGLDSSVLVRFLVEDEPEQAEKAARLIQKGTEEGSCFVSDAALCETVWVLKSVYGYGPEDLQAVIRKLKMSPQIRFQDPEGVDRALTRFENGKGDFPDYLIGERGRKAGCRATATFDRKLLKDDLFIHP